MGIWRRFFIYETVAVIGTDCPKGILEGLLLQKYHMLDIPLNRISFQDVSVSKSLKFKVI